MSTDPYKELREAREELRKQWNWGGGAGLAKAIARERAAVLRVSEIERAHPRPLLTWPSK